MTYTFDDYNYVVKLKKGEHLAAALEQFCNETQLHGAWVSGLGGTLEATLGFYNLETKEYEWRTFEGLREIVSLGGNLAADKDGKIMFHLHGVLSDREFQTVGGHVKDLVAGATVELFVHRTWKPLGRTLDREIGLQTLDLK
jgi:predicted DNA-binding protein with PD1-like motif